MRYVAVNTPNEYKDTFGFSTSSGTYRTGILIFDNEAQHDMFEELGYEDLREGVNAWLKAFFNEELKNDGEDIERSGSLPDNYMAVDFSKNVE